MAGAGRGSLAALALALAALAALAGGCGAAPPASAPTVAPAPGGAASAFAADLDLICQAPRRAELQGGTAEQRAAAISAYVEVNVRSAEGRALLNASPEELVRRLRAAVERAGLARCPLLELAGAAEPAARPGAAPA
ncbi:MAG TPA: hypothetical protein VGQ83_41165, partial [Polyangia bacterium]